MFEVLLVFEWSMQSGMGILFSSFLASCEVSGPFLTCLALASADSYPVRMRAKG